MSELPLVEDPGARIGAALVHGVLLAAGTSDRFGATNKLLATVDGQPMVRKTARTLVDADLEGISAVVGHQAANVEAAVEGLGVEIIRNDAYQEGMATSVRAGVQAVRATGADAALIALGDMPDVSSASVSALVAAYENDVGSALAAAYEGRRGNPVLFDRCHFDALAAVDGDTGGRNVLLGAEDAALVETGDPGVLQDVDTRADFDQP